MSGFRPLFVPLLEYSGSSSGLISGLIQTSISSVCFPPQSSGLCLCSHQVAVPRPWNFHPPCTCTHMRSQIFVLSHVLSANTNKLQESRCPSSGINKQQTRIQKQEVESETWGRRWCERNLLKTWLIASFKLFVCTGRVSFYSVFFGC